ncbi:MAG: transposase [Phycisphaeraceae bacterium]
MPRAKRVTPGGYVYHVLNRGVGRMTIFNKPEDYRAFTRVLVETCERVPGVELLAYCLMPNHWHLLLRPRRGGDLSEFMRLLTVTHTQRYHAHYRTAGTGPVYHGRFKSFPIEDEAYFLAAARYVERNALRAGLVERAEDWLWSSLRARREGAAMRVLVIWPVPGAGQGGVCRGWLGTATGRRRRRSSVIRLL